VPDERVLAYVRASAALLQLPLDDARVQAVAAHLERTAALADLLAAAALPVEAEPAEVYRPMAFPAQDPDPAP
jgi:hypothetical protein